MRKYSIACLCLLGAGCITFFLGVGTADSAQGSQPVYLFTSFRGDQLIAVRQTLPPPPVLPGYHADPHLAVFGDNTRDPRYSVAYGTATSPLGPFQKAENNPILQGKGMVQGAGHHSVVQVPGKDLWFIAYHRFAIPDGSGYRRETCISPLRLHPDGSIQKVNVFEAAVLNPALDQQPGSGGTDTLMPSSVLQEHYLSTHGHFH